MKKVCEICGQTYEAYRSYQRTCSKTCAAVLYRQSNRTPNCDPFRPVTDTTVILVEAYWRRDNYSAEQIARELKRDVSVIEHILTGIKKRQPMVW